MIKIDKVKLNLGSGKFPKEHYINVDINEKYEADIYHNLDIFPWPLPSNHFEIIEADHILEHITDLRGAFKELNRILALDGKLVIKVPHFTRGFTHWDHKHGFDITFPIYFNKNISGSFEGVDLIHNSTRLVWFGQVQFKRQQLSRISFMFGKTLGYIFDFLGNINHYFTSRLFSFWIGGYDEIIFKFIKSNK